MKYALAIAGIAAFAFFHGGTHMWIWAAAGIALVLHHRAYDGTPS